MLVLSRKTQEAILVGENIEIKVLAIKGGRVSLGIKAPQSVPVRRLEVELQDTDHTATELDK